MTTRVMIFVAGITDYKRHRDDLSIRLHLLSVYFGSRLLRPVESEKPGSFTTRFFTF